MQDPDSRAAFPFLRDHTNFPTSSVREMPTELIELEVSLGDPLDFPGLRLHINTCLGRPKFLLGHFPRICRDLDRSLGSSYK
jgi:hypothetical protein